MSLKQLILMLLTGKTPNFIFNRLKKRHSVMLNATCAHFLKNETHLPVCSFCLHELFCNSKSKISSFFYLQWQQQPWWYQVKLLYFWMKQEQWEFHLDQTWLCTAFWTQRNMSDIEFPGFSANLDLFSRSQFQTVKISLLTKLNKTQERPAFCQTLIQTTVDGTSAKSL